MFEFLKKIMNNDESHSSHNNPLHRILKTYIKKDPNLIEDEIIFGCGCFWGAEKCFWKLPGVVTTSVGYAGGNKINPTYYEVCSGLTGHSEVVRVVWDKTKIDISDLLKMFWECHDPTQKIDKEMIWEVSIGQLFIIKVRIIKILYWPVKGNIRKN